MTAAQPDDEADVDVFEETGASEASIPPPRWVALPPAGMLSIADADSLLRWREASLVAIVGERNGGKTTLATELYERFLRGPFAEVVFSHSLSLLGFEQKSFQSRAESRGTKPDTPRTSTQDGLNFFHLAVSDQDDLQRTDLLISERAGEAYREVRDRPAMAMELVEIRKASTVTFILDGERLADGRRRAEAIASVRNIARAFTDAGAVAPEAEVQLVTTKCDLLPTGSAAAALDALAALEQRFVASYSGRFAAATTFRIAARDPEGKIEPGEGLAPLLRSWLKPPMRPHLEPPRLPPLIDEFDRLLLRRRN